MALLINILLFDLRDRVGNQCAGVRTLANRLQPRSFFALLGVLLIVELGLALLEKRFELMALSIYLCALVCLSGRKQSPGFYHWAVDGMLFVPFLTSF